MRLRARFRMRNCWLICRRIFAKAARVLAVLFAVAVLRRSLKAIGHTQNIHSTCKQCSEGLETTKLGLCLLVERSQHGLVYWLPSSITDTVGVYLCEHARLSSAKMDHTPTRGKIRNSPFFICQEWPFAHERISINLLLMIFWDLRLPFRCRGFSIVGIASNQPLWQILLKRFLTLLSCAI